MLLTPLLRDGETSVCINLVALAYSCYVTVVRPASVGETSSCDNVEDAHNKGTVPQTLHLSRLHKYVFTQSIDNQR